MEKIKIIDIIDHQNKYYVQRIVVLNRDPEYLYDKKDNWLIAEDSGFFSFYKYDLPSPGFYAFAGRKFDIKMKDGSTEKAYGQWWNATPPDYSGLLSYPGYNTPEGLARCNVFFSGSVDPDIIEKWLSENEPSNNYNKYNKGHINFGKQTIISLWNK